jgi:hypothetical protein
MHHVTVGNALCGAADGRGDGDGAEPYVVMQNLPPFSACVLNRNQLFALFYAFAIVGAHGVRGGRGAPDGQLRAGEHPC